MRHSDLEAVRRDRFASEPNLIGKVIKVNKVKGTVDVRTKGEIAQVLFDVPLVGQESVFSLEVGDNIALSYFPGQWLAVGGVQSKTRRRDHFFGRTYTRELLQTYDARIHGDLEVWGNIQLRTQALNTVSSIAQGFPGLRGYWPMTALGWSSSYQVRDLSCCETHLDNTGTTTFGYDVDYPLMPCAFLNGSSQYLTRADGGAANWSDITGTESYIEGTVDTVWANGLTLGGWFLPYSFGSDKHLMSKWGSAGQRSYRLTIDSTGMPELVISSDGTAEESSSVAVPVVEANRWHCIFGRYSAKWQTLEVFVDGEWITEETTLADIFDSTTAFNIGGRANGTELFNGMVSFSLLCAAAVPHESISAFYSQSKALPEMSHRASGSYG